MKKKKVKTTEPTKITVSESLSYKVEVRDKEGRLVQQIEAPSRSYVEQYIRLIKILADRLGGTVKDTGGVDRSVTYTTYNLGCDAAIGDSSMGIRIGKGSTAVTISDYALETALAEGVGADQVEHQAMVFTAAAVDGSTCSFTLSRVMVNNSGSDITGIREIGLYTMMHVTTNSPYRCMAFRDVLPGSFTIPDGGSVTVTYTISATV